MKSWLQMSSQKPVLWVHFISNILHDLRLIWAEMPRAP